MILFFLLAVMVVLMQRNETVVIPTANTKHVLKSIENIAICVARFLVIVMVVTLFDYEAFTSN